MHVLGVKISLDHLNVSFPTPKQDLQLWFEHEPNVPVHAGWRAWKNPAV